MTLDDHNLTELCQRNNCGISVALFWNQASNELCVYVEDAQTDDRFLIPVRAAEAIDAFYHPFVYAPSDNAEEVV